MMGGYGSGRQYGRPVVEQCLFVEIGWMLKNGRAVVGRSVRGILRWSSRGQETGSISYEADMRDPEAAMLRLSYSRDKGPLITQSIMLCYTKPHFGGRRWWMICPHSQDMCAKLFLPPGGDSFASRSAWRLGYYSQRETERDRVFSKLFKLQKRLGCTQGWEMSIRRPKGMWQRTFDRHDQRYWELDAICSAEMDSVLARLR
jgi:hypothetical protein